MSKICRKCHILLILLICGLCCFALPVAAGDNGAATCSAEQMEKIEKNLDNAAKEGLKNSKALLDAYNAAANQYVASCNANLATNTPVHWNKDAVAAAYGRDAGLAADLMGNPESAKNMYKYTGVVWSAENPTSNECKTLRGQADSALQAYNNSRTTTTALLYRAGGNKVPRACVCSENGAHQECVAFTTSDSEAKETDDTQCLTLNEYLADYAMCPLCPIFEIILNTDGKIAHISWSKIASALSKVVMAFFLVFLALETLKLVSSMGGGSTSSYLKAIFTLGLKVLITVILLQNSTYVYGYFVSPVIRGGLDMGQEFVKLGTENSVSSCHLNSANEAFATIEGHELDSSLLSDIYSTIRCFNNSAGTIPAVGRLLICQGWENPGKFMPDLSMLLAGIINYVFGLMIWLAVVFYMIDCTVQLGMVCCLVPLFVACWPFKMTQRYTFTGVKVILNTFFNFVLMGVVILLGIELINFALDPGGNTGSATLTSVLNAPNLDIKKLKKVVDMDGMALLGLIICCVMSLKLIAKANNMAAKFSSGAGMQIGNKMGGVAASTATSIGTATGGMALKAGWSSAKGLAKKAGNTDAGRYVKGKYRSGVNAVRRTFGMSERATGSGLEDNQTPSAPAPIPGGSSQTSNQQQNPPTTQNQASDNSSAQNQQTQGAQNRHTENQHANSGGEVHNQRQDVAPDTTKGDESSDWLKNSTSKVKRDNNGHITASQTFDKNGVLRLASKENADGSRTEQSFHANGKVQTLRRVDKEKNEVGQQYGKDGSLELEWQNNADGSSVSKNYLTGIQETKDANGKVSRQNIPAGKRENVQTNKKR